MADVAVLALEGVKLDGRKARVYAFADRLELVDADGLRTLPLTSVARITTRSSLRRGRVVVTDLAGRVHTIGGMRARDAAVAYRILVGLAEDANA